MLELLEALVLLLLLLLELAWWWPFALCLEGEVKVVRLMEEPLPELMAERKLWSGLVEAGIGRVGAPETGLESTQSMRGACAEIEGDTSARRWLEGVVDSIESSV